MSDGVKPQDDVAIVPGVNDEPEAEIELSPAELAALDEAIADADANCSEAVSSAVVLAELDQIACAAR